MPYVDFRGIFIYPPLLIFEGIYVVGVFWGVFFCRLTCKEDG